MTDAGRTGKGLREVGIMGFQTFGFSTPKRLKHCWGQIKDCQLFKRSGDQRVGDT